MKNLHSSAQKSSKVGVSSSSSSARCIWSRASAGSAATASSHCFTSRSVNQLDGGECWEKISCSTARFSSENIENALNILGKVRKCHRKSLENHRRSQVFKRLRQDLGWDAEHHAPRQLRDGEQELLLPQPSLSLPKPLRNQAKS